MKPDKKNWLEEVFKVAEGKSRSVLTPSAQGNPFFDVIMHEVHFPETGAAPRKFFTVEHKFFACSAVCLDKEGRLPLVRIPRFPLRDSEGDEWSWELPGGRSREPEIPVECIARELREETGLVAESFDPILKDYYYPESSFGTEKLYLFLARNVQAVGQKVPETEGSPKLKWFDFDKAVDMVFEGQIRSSWTIIGILATKILMERTGSGRL